MLLKKATTCVFLFFSILNAVGQGKQADTLRLALIKATVHDTVRVNALKGLSVYYMDVRPDSALTFNQEGYELAVKTNSLIDQAYFLNAMGNDYVNLGDYVRALNLYYSAKSIYHQITDLWGEAKVYNNMGSAYNKRKEFNKALAFLQYGLKIYDRYKLANPLKSNREKLTGLLLYLNLGDAYRYLNKLDSASFYTRLSYTTWQKSPVPGEILGEIVADLGEIEKAKGNKDVALEHFRKAISLCLSAEDMDDLSVTYLSIADLYHKYKKQDSAEYYGQEALKVGIDNKLPQDVLYASQALYNYFEEDHNLPLSHKYLKLATATNDSLFSQDKVRQMLALDFDEKQKQREIEIVAEKEWTNVRAYFLIFGLISFSIVAFLFWRESRQRAKTNRQLDLVNQSLESKVYERTKDLEDKNDKLFKYSYYLSHQIRGPISTIKGLVNIEKEGLCEPADFIKMVGVCVDDIDSKIVEINDILHDQGEIS